MSHTTYTQGNKVDFWLLVVGSQIANLIPGLSFGHNLCFKGPNGSCEPILNIYVLIYFQWYKGLFNPLGFDPCNCFLKMWESIGPLNSQNGSSLESVRVHSSLMGFFLAHNLASFCLGREPKARVVTPLIFGTH